MSRPPSPNSATLTVDLAELQKVPDKHYFSHLLRFLLLMEEVKSLIRGFWWFWVFWWNYISWLFASFLNFEVFVVIIICYILRRRDNLTKKKWTGTSAAFKCLVKTHTWVQYTPVCLIIIIYIIIYYII